MSITGELPRQTACRGIASRSGTLLDQPVWNARGTCWPAREKPGPRRYGCRRWRCPCCPLRPLSCCGLRALFPTARLSRRRQKLLDSRPASCLCLASGVLTEAGGLMSLASSVWGILYS